MDYKGEVQLSEYKVLLDTEIENCKAAINQHKKFAEVRIIILRMNELEAIIDVLLQNYLS